jgi:hypothetical protein
VTNVVVGYLPEMDINHASNDIQYNKFWIVTARVIQLIGFRSLSVNRSKNSDNITTIFDYLTLFLIAFGGSRIRDIELVLL